MRVSRLNKRIVIQESINKKNDEGYLEEVWLDKKAIWAYAKPNNSNEFYKANSINSRSNIKFNIRYVEDLNTDMRIKYANKYYNILSIEDVDEAHREMWILCEVIE